MKPDKALAAIEAGLAPDERPLASGPAEFQNSRKNVLLGAVALTGRRLRFVGSAIFDRADISVPLEAIVSIETKRAALATVTTIGTAGATLRFHNIPAEVLAALAKARAAARTTPPLDTPVSDAPIGAPVVPTAGVDGASTRAAGSPAARIEATVPPASPGRPASTADELAKLAALHASGALTDAEFTAAKAQLLG